MSLGTTYSPHSPLEGLQVTNFDQCLHTVMVILKCTDYPSFQGDLVIGGGKVEKKGLCGGELSMEEFVMEEENFHHGGAGFSSII